MLGDGTTTSRSTPQRIGPSHTWIAMSSQRDSTLGVRQDGTLSVTAFRLGQHDLASLPGFVEKFDGKPAQVTLAEIESVTGLSFGSLKKHDHFAAGGAPGTLEIARSGGGGGKRRAKPIGTFEDIVV